MKKLKVGDYILYKPSKNLRLSYILNNFNYYNYSVFAVFNDGIMLSGEGGYNGTYIKYDELIKRFYTGRRLLIEKKYNKNSNDNV